MLIFDLTKLLKIFKYPETSYLEITFLEAEKIYESDVRIFNFMLQYVQKILSKKGIQLTKENVFRHHLTKESDKSYVSIFSDPISEFSVLLLMVNNGYRTERLLNWTNING